MNKKLLVTSSGLALLITGAILFIAMQPQSVREAKDSMNAQDMPARSQPAAQNPDTPVSNTPTPGSYVDYKDDAIASTPGTKLLFFYASWCPQCRDLDADIKKTGVPNDTTIFKVNYDTRQDLRQKYGVTIQTTVVKVTDKGDLAAKFVAYDTPTLAAVFKALQ